MRITIEIDTAGDTAETLSALAGSGLHAALTGVVPAPAAPAAPAPAPEPPAAPPADPEPVTEEAPRPRRRPVRKRAIRKAEEPKAEEPKAEEPKAEEPKAEEPPSQLRSAAAVALRALMPVEGGREAAIEVLHAHGGASLGAVADDRLDSLVDALHARLGELK